MDRRQRPARLLGLAVLLLVATAADAPQLPIREARWLKTPDLLADLTTQPAECLAMPKDAALRQSVETGRALFRSPLMLGGQAARVGLSCSSCHRNGRSNPHFHFPGISGDPGTADVTASIMSSHRGDDIFNPKPIPDLGGEPAKLRISRDPTKRDLSVFIHGLITQEFDGPEPSPAALDSVVAYVNALGPGACVGKTDVPITLAVLGEGSAARTLHDRLAGTGYVPADVAEARCVLYVADPGPVDTAENDLDCAVRLSAEVADLVRQLVGKLAAVGRGVGVPELLPAVIMEPQRRRLRRHLAFLHQLGTYLLARVEYQRRVPDRIEHRLYHPLIAGAGRLRRLGPVLANGSVHRYLAYGFLGVTVLLLTLAVTR